MATIQQLIQEYSEKAQQVRSLVTFPYIDNIGENSLNAGRELAYKGIISILERHLRGDFPLSKVCEILQNLIASSEKQADTYNLARREVYVQALAALNEQATTNEEA